jgi:UDP-N-acetylmuramate dehydrogenase
MNNFQKISQIDGVELFENINLERFTTMRLSVWGDFAIVKSTNALKQLIFLLNESNKRYNMVGWGANQIIHTTKDTLFIKLDFEFDRSYLKQVHHEYLLPASVSLNVLTSHAQKFGLLGWEVFTGIPASLGGAIFMNAGTSLGEIGELIKEVKILQTDGDFRSEVITENSFKYRGNNFVKSGEVIVSAILKNKGVDSSICVKIKNYLDLRKSTQPLATKNCGCVFKNFDQYHKAGQFIDLTGLKGLTLNGLRVSELHANFIENFDNGASDDFLTLTELLQEQLELFTGIKFELEAKIY